MLGNISSKPDEKCVGKRRQADLFRAWRPVWRAPREFLRSARRDVNKHLIFEKTGSGKAGAGNKPGSVEDNHSSATAVTGCLKQPTREPARNRRHACALLPYLVLLRAGFAVPRPVTSRAVRSYRTFSPLPAVPAVSFLWHFPWARALQALPGALSEGARTFLRPLARAAIVWPTPAFPDRGFYLNFRPSHGKTVCNMTGSHARRAAKRIGAR